MEAQPIIVFPPGGRRGIPSGVRGWLEELAAKRKLLALADDAPSGIEAIHCFLAAGGHRQEELNGLIELAVRDGVARELTPDIRKGG
ncbi:MULTISPECIES: hypothetical protein [unclassified Paenibacillus]|uniref:hypothetical protein n=1 Tax=unclassified Paenibacillus TaxID=185978 RepID=UPI001052E359|nr:MULTISPECIES: hypothetical protein [unclassified Paenibacillus]NIK71114.1 hypothetical protein [Paenibacillus sp. BK720]TCM97165.1 hypothetical protein EV294_104378 [Paenibacillus sp. BK033]